MTGGDIKNTHTTTIMELPITPALAAHAYFRQCLALAESHETHSVAGPDVLVEAGELMEAVDADKSATAAQRRDAKALLEFVAPNKNWDEETVSKYFQSAILRYYDRRTESEADFEAAIERFTAMVGRQHPATSAVAGAMGRRARGARTARTAAVAAAADEERPEEAAKRRARNKKKAAQKKNKAKERKEAGLPPKQREPREDPRLYEDID